MTAMMTLADNSRSGWPPVSGCTRLSTLRKQDPDPIIHLVDFDSEAETRTVRLLAATGMETMLHANAGALMDRDLPDAPGCIFVHARLARTGTLDFLAHFRRSGPGLPIIVAADRADARTVVFAMKAGAVDFLEMPMGDGDMISAVATAIGIDRERRRAGAYRAAVQARFDTLTPRERQVMALVTRGLLNKQVAGDLGLSEVTVKVHRGSAMRKMGAPTLADLVRMADMVAGPTVRSEA